MRLNLLMDKNFKEIQHSASAKCENAPLVIHWWQPKRRQYPKISYLDFNDKHCLLLRELTTVPKSRVINKNLQGISMMSAKRISK